MSRQPEPEPTTARAKLYKLASDLDATLTTMGAACQALMSFLDLSTEPILPLADRIHYQAGALDMADEMETFFPFVQSAIPKIRKQLLDVQGQATQEATNEASQSKGPRIQDSGAA